MKTARTLLALLLTLALVMAFAVTASAADPMGHSYVAYQIFQGTTSIEDSAGNTIPTTLSDVEWGSDISDTAAFLAALKTEFSGLSSAATAKDVAEFLSGQGDDSDIALRFARVASKYVSGNGKPVTNGNPSGLDDGYYLIVDKGPLASVDDAANLSLLQMAEDGKFEIQTKTTVPTVEKKVDDVNDSTGVQELLRDSADYDIGDEVPYTITFEVDGNKLQYFQTYSLQLNDTLDDGLTFNRATAVLKCNGQDVPVDWTNSLNSVNTGNVNGQTFTITLKNIKDASSIPNNALKTNDTNTFVLTFTATLNERAVTGCNATTGKGNDNTVNLEYSKNPNRPDYVQSGNYYLPNNEPLPNNPQGGTDFNKTPDDVVRVFTYKLVIHKVDENGQPLEGAKFQLYKYNAATSAYETVGPEQSGSGTPANTFTWTGLDEGMYKLVETENPKGYNKIADSYFTVSATHTDDGGATPLRLTSLTVADTNGQNNYVKFADADPNTTNVTDGNIATGTFEGDVINEPGVILPETGDEGTQMLYVVGSVMLLGALVLIVTKKRAGEQA